LIALKLNLTSGKRHPKFADGVTLPAIALVAATTNEDAEKVAERELGARGWIRWELFSFKGPVSEASFEGDPVMHGAFCEAESSGFSVVVFP
jgi:hypothetical protein